MYDFSGIVSRHSTKILLHEEKGGAYDYENGGAWNAEIKPREARAAVFNLTSRDINSAMQYSEGGSYTKGDISKKRIEQPKFVLSISAVSNDDAEALRIAENAADWFKFLGKEYLNELNAVITEVSAIGDRTALVVDDYEKRHGFDVTVRTIREVSKVIETIESYTFNHYGKETVEKQIRGESD